MDLPPDDAVFTRGHVKRKSVALLIRRLIDVRNECIGEAASAALSVRGRYDVDVCLAVQADLAGGNRNTTGAHEHGRGDRDTGCGPRDHDLKGFKLILRRVNS